MGPKIGFDFLFERFRFLFVAVDAQQAGPFFSIFPGGEPTYAGRGAGDLGLQIITRFLPTGGGAGGKVPGRGDVGGQPAVG